jgi:hypothetical protein
LITPQQNLPNDGSIKYNNLQLSRGFTPQQRAELTGEVPNNSAACTICAGSIQFEFFKRQLLYLQKEILVLEKIRRALLS